MSHEILIGAADTIREQYPASQAEMIGYPEPAPETPAEDNPAATTTIYVDDEQPWQEKAACRGPQSVLFYPPPHFERKDEKVARVQRAKAVCASCIVRRECLEYAISIREDHGIWGGLTEEERRRMLK